MPSKKTVANVESSPESGEETVWQAFKLWWDTLPKTRKRKLLPLGLLVALATTLLTTYIKTAFSTTVLAHDTRVDVHVRLLGLSAPGDAVALAPIGDVRQIDHSGEVTWLAVPFDQLRDKLLEVQLVHSFDRRTIWSHHVGDKPMIAIYYEVNRNASQPSPK